ncbi:MAG: SIMPL domain-containing protein [Flavobacterium sp.]|nr:MAG: SIMPL domain-containing protein [Flavobacterium sp.]
MKTQNTLLVLLLLFGINMYSQNGSKNFIDQPYIEVSGQFETELIPNEIYLNIILNENDKKGKISIEKQENQLIIVLKKLNINTDKNLFIKDFDGSYKKIFLGTNKVTKVKTYQLLISNGKTLGEVYRVLAALNISTMYIEKVSHSEIEKFKREIKIKALQVAKKKASDYAKAIDQSIGKAIYIQESISNSFTNRANTIQVIGYGSIAISEEDKIPNLNFQTIKLTAVIQAKFILN